MKVRLVVGGLAVAMLAGAAWSVWAEPASSVVAGGPGKQYQPSIAGDVVAYSDCGSGKCRVRGMNVATGQPFNVSSPTWAEDQPNTDGKYVVWRDYRNATQTDQAHSGHMMDTNIVAEALGSKQEITVTSAPNEQAYPFVSGNIVVWTDYRSAKGPEDSEAGDIYMYDLASGKETQVSGARSAQVRPVTNGKVIVWQDYRNEKDPKGFNSDIYGYDIATNQEFAISIAYDQQSDPAISGNIVVWTDFRNGPGNADIYGYDLAARKEILVDDAPGDQMNPSISGNTVVWQDYRNGEADIYGYDLGTRQEFPVYTGKGTQQNPRVSGDRVVWEDLSNRDNDVDILGASVSASMAELPGAGSQTFPETGKSVSGIFLAYWKGNGGLAQQGYPISDVMREVSPLNGRSYLVQYFERAVFEYHPENQPPYNVLLSQLGTFRYKQKYPTGAPNQTPNNSPGSVLFPQTGHRVGGTFLEYWNAHGGLAQQGYPISDEFQEKSDLNGQTYTVQYFERAVFEYHPENQPPYNVLLSQLGTFQYRTRYGGK